jgi:hypothetical protein
VTLCTGHMGNTPSMKTLVNRTLANAYSWRRTRWSFSHSCPARRPTHTTPHPMFAMALILGIILIPALGLAGVGPSARHGSLSRIERQSDVPSAKESTCAAGSHAMVEKSPRPFVLLR